VDELAGAIVGELVCELVGLALDCPKAVCGGWLSQHRKSKAIPKITLQITLPVALLNILKTAEVNSDGLCICICDIDFLKRVTKLLSALLFRAYSASNNSLNCLKPIFCHLPVTKQPVESISGSLSSTNGFRCGTTFVFTRLSHPVKLDAFASL